MLKTKYQNGHFKEVLSELDSLMEKINVHYEIFPEGEASGGFKRPEFQSYNLKQKDKVEYYYYKMMYMKAKTLRKVR